MTDNTDKKRYTSLSIRFVTALALCTILPMLICSYFFLRYEQAKALDEYVDRSRNSMMVSSENIEHYIKTSIASTRNVYVDSQVLHLLSSGSPQDFLSRDAEGPQRIFSFMQSIYNVTPDAVQLRLISNRLNKSFLLITNNLQKSLMSVGVSEMELPHFNLTTDVWLEPTHNITSYGHTIHYHSGQDRSMQVFTIWLPIFKLDSSRELLATLAIDMPISLIETNCQPSLSMLENILVADKAGNIIAGSTGIHTGSDLSDNTIMSLLTDSSEEFSSSMTESSLYLQTGFQSVYIPWKIIKTVPKESVYQNINSQIQLLLIIFAAGVFLATILNSFTVIHFMNPLRKATAYMRDVRRSREGTTLQLSDYVIYKRNDELKILFDSLEEMIDSIENHTIREYKLELLNQSTLLKMLQAQINPHFVYNTLQCLATNALKEHQVLQYDYISALGHMLHYAMDLSTTLSTIGAEEAYVSHYFSLQKMRFSSGSTLIFHHNGLEACRIPKMTLQPLIENSIYHGGILNKSDGCIHVICSQDQQDITIQIIDNGIPISPTAEHDLYQKLQSLHTWFAGRSGQKYQFHMEEQSEFHAAAAADLSAEQILHQNESASERLQSGLHIGIENVYRRLLLTFGPLCRFRLYANDAGGTTVEIGFPVLSSKGGTYEYSDR